MAIHIWRREVVVPPGWMPAAWPLVPQGQQTEWVPRVGMPMRCPDAIRKDSSPLWASQEGLQKLGWVSGRSDCVEVGTLNASKTFVEGTCTP
jgi:hypothetical protein